MSWNDPDGEPYPELTREEFIQRLIEMGFIRKVAEAEWERFPKPVYAPDLEW